MPRIHIVFATLIVSIGITACQSTSGGGSVSYNVKYFGQCGALYNGDSLVTTYNRRSGKTTAYATGKGCKTSHPKGAEVGFAIFDTMQLEDFFVRGMRANKDGVMRRTIIRKDGPRYVARSTLVK